jgi:hypothetical protein
VDKVNSLSLFEIEEKKQEEDYAEESQDKQANTESD